MKIPQQSIPKAFIPLSKPFLDGRTLEYIRTVLDSGKLSGDGPMCKSVEAQLRSLFSLGHALLTTSGTHALEMAMMLLDLKPGDEVITPSFTFVSTANAILRAGAAPVFCEINDQTFTIDLDDFERHISPKTRAVFPVHYAGISPDMDSLQEIARAHGIAVVEDAAQGVNAKYKGRFLGSIGQMSAYSFHDTKNYVSGEGGAFTTNDESLARRAEIVREKGTNRANFIRGEVDKYTWVDHGSSYILSDILAAVLKSQLERIDEIQNGRRRVHDFYIQELQGLAQRERLRLPIIPEYAESNYHIFSILLQNESERNRIARELKAMGVGTTFHYIPLHSSPFAQRVLGTRELHLPVTDRVSGSLLRLPIYPQLEEPDLAYIVECLHEALK